MSKEKNSIMGTYHTNLRNVGLFSSLSMALLSFSERRVLKKDISNNVLFGLGIVFLVISFILSKELKDYSEKNEKDISKKLNYVAKIINYTLVVFLTVVIYSVLHRLGVF
jgi:hypothetical protein